MEHLFVVPQVFFQPDWRSAWPTAANDCGGSAGCDVHGNTCLCDTAVQTSAVFTGELPSAAEMLSQLHIGATTPDTYDAGTYTLSAQWSTAEVEVWTLADGALDVDTIFKITSSGETVWRANVETLVNIDGGFVFRSPVQFSLLHNPTTASASQETEAVIDEAFKHENTAPFFSKALIQRLVSSNPSPRYVRAVALAFRTGTYSQFGSGEYGDLEAVIAAIFLDREARSETLDADVSHGIMREPIVKLMSVLRSLEYRSPQRRPVYLHRLIDVLGQEAFRSPSVS
jgi:hypothetical protein